MILEGVGEVRLPDGEEGGDVKVQDDLHQELGGDFEESHSCEMLGRLRRLMENRLPPSGSYSRMWCDVTRLADTVNYPDS